MWITNIFKNIYSDSESTDKAQEFLRIAAEKRNQLVEKNTKKIINELRKNMDEAVNVGHNCIYFWIEDYKQVYDGCFNLKAIIEWMNSWCKYEGFYIDIKGGRYKLSWDLD